MGNTVGVVEVHHEAAQTTLIILTITITHNPKFQKSVLLFVAKICNYYFKIEIHQKRIAIYTYSYIYTSTMDGENMQRLCYCTDQRNSRIVNITTTYLRSPVKSVCLLTANKSARRTTLSELPK